MKFLASTVLAAVASLAAVTSVMAQGQTIHIVVPGAPGGSGDIVVRAMAPRLAAVLNQTVVVENRPGAATAIGTDYVASSKPDGTTLLVGGVSLVTAPLVNKSVKTTLKDMTPVANLFLTPIVIVAGADFPANNTRELVDIYKDKPAGTLAYASLSAGFRMSAEVYSQATGIKMTHVPYASRAAAVGDVSSGRVGLMMDTLQSALPLIQSGRLKVIVVSGNRRHPKLPNVPTAAESGFTDGFDEDLLQGLLGPANVPSDVVERLGNAIRKVYDDQAFIAEVEHMTLIPSPVVGKDFHKMLVEAQARYARVAKKVGIEPQ